MNPRAFAWLLRPSRQSAMASATPAATSAVAGFVSFTIAGLAWKLWHLGDRHEAYMVLAAMSLACLLVPVTAVSAASARMQSRQQEGKVSTLRLLGMSAATSRLLVVCEVAIPSCIGVAIGWCGSLLVAPIMDLISFGEDEGTPHPIDVRPSWEGTAVVASGLVLAAILSGIHRLNRAVNAPMSVSARDRPPIVRGTRVVVAIVALTACLSAMHLASASWGVVVIVLVLILAMLVLMSIWNLLGPYLVRRRGNRLLLKNYSPAELVTARALLEDPAAAWRQVSPLALMSFLVVPACSILGFLNAVTRGPTQLTHRELILFDDVRWVVLLVTISAFILVACSSVVYQIAGIAERRDLYLALTYMGAPVRLLKDAHLRRVMAPLAVSVVGPAALAVVALFPLVAISVVTSPWSFGIALACLGTGTALVRLGAIVTGRYLQAIVAK
ncbi:MAG: FtsX-like permease family protein [Peptidiphaga sp.]